MPTILQYALTLLTGEDYKPNASWLKMPKKRPLKVLTERELLKLESEIGAQIFGPLPTGHQREFFNLDPTTWIWYEEWTEGHKTKNATTRYEVHNNGILKVQEGARYSYLDGQELQNLIAAIHMYYEKVARNIYKIDPDTGQPL